MQPRIALAIAAALAGLAGCAGEKPDADVEGVAQAWARFKDANISGNGKIASEWVTSGTHEYFEELIEAALNATRAELGEMPSAKQAIVLLTRTSVPPSELQEMSGRTFFVHAVDKGWTRHKDRGVTNVHVSGSRASANVMKTSEASMIELQFVRERGGWRFDFRSLIGMLNLPFDTASSLSGRTKRETITMFVEQVIGRQLTESDWNPINTKQTAPNQPLSRGGADD